MSAGRCPCGKPRRKNGRYCRDCHAAAQGRYRQAGARAFESKLRRAVFRALKALGARGRVVAHRWPSTTSSNAKRILQRRKEK